MKKPIALVELLKGLSGKVELTAVDPKSGLVIAHIIQPNTVVTVGKYLVASLLAAKYGTGLSHCAIGTDDTAVVVSQTVLGAEANRKATTLAESELNVSTALTYFTLAESTYYIKESGMFGGGASLVPNSGMMFSRALISYDNSGGLTDVSVLWTITVG